MQEECEWPGPDELTQWESGAKFSLPSRGSGLTPSGQSLINALEYDLTREDSDTSEHDKVATQVGVQTRRLRLVWSQEENLPRSQWHQEVRVAEGVIRELAARIGSVPHQGSLSRAVRQQRWSPLNVPIMWAAAGSSASTPVVDWLAQILSSIREPINFHENHLSVSEAVRIGWSAIRGVFRSWGISAREDLTSWLQSHGFPATQAGNHISARAQEYLLTEACNFDVRVALFEVCVRHGDHTHGPRVGDGWTGAIRSCCSRNSGKPIVHRSPQSRPELGPVG